MTIDIEQYFNRAINLAEYWSIDNLFPTARILQKKIPGSFLEWDCQDLEYWSDFTGLQIAWFLINHDEKTWLSIEKDKEKVAYLRVDLPLIILLDKYAKIVKDEDIFKNIEIFLAPDFNSKIYTIKQKALKKLFLRRNKSIDFFNLFINNFDLEQFSIKEFWWYSIIPPPEKEVKLDLTNLFIELDYNNTPTLNELLLATNKITNYIPESNLNYEYGEGWASITTSKEVVCFIGVYMSIIFALDKYVEIIQKSLDVDNVVILPVDSFEKQEYSMNFSLIKEKHPSWLLQHLPPVFAIDDFMFYIS